MFNYNFSTLFSSLNSSSFSSSFNLSDYNMIKSGSYKKLLKSYFSQQKDTTTSKPDKTTTTNKKTETKDTTGLSKMKSEADSLRKAAEAFDKSDVFKQSNGNYDTDKITSAVKDFVKEYNDTIDQSAKVTSKDVTQQTGFMKSMTNTMSKALSNIGVTVGTDGKLTLNEDTFKKADMKDVKALFSGSQSYASQISRNASAVSSAALRSSSIYSGYGTTTSAISGMFNDWV